MYSIVYNRSVRTTLRDRVAELMSERGIGQRELARRSGLSVSYVNQLVNGNITDPGADKLVQLAAGLEVNVNELVKGIRDLSRVDRFLSPTLAKIQKLELLPESEQRLLAIAEAFKALEQQQQSQAREADHEQGADVGFEESRPHSMHSGMIGEEVEQYKA